MISRLGLAARGAGARSWAVGGAIHQARTIVPPGFRSQARMVSAMSVMEMADQPNIPTKQPQQPTPLPPPSLRELKVGFIGWGAMAQAVSLGLVRQNLTSADQVMATDVVPSVLAAAKAEGLLVTSSNRDLVEWADVVVMAVKPQVVDPVTKEIAPFWRPNQVLVSICAGVTIQSYKNFLGDGSKIVRVMPNTPCLIGQAATAYDGSAACEDWELELIHGMFAAVGKATHHVPEYLLNAVTGVSGSGPAYVYMMIQALSDAGVHGGLPRSVALSLAAQTVAGSAQMVLETGMHPAVLKEAVTSPAGTTIAGVRTLERLAFNSAIIEAVEAARHRSEELSKTPDFLFDQKKGS